MYLEFSITKDFSIFSWCNQHLGNTFWAFGPTRKKDKSNETKTKQSLQHFKWGIYKPDGQLRRRELTK